MDSPKSSLVSSQGAASRRLPNGCGRELNGLSLYRDQGRASDILRTAGDRPRHQPPSGRTPSIPGGIRGSSKVQGVLGHVLEESPYP